MIYKLVSSAKSLIDESMSSTISLMYKRKSDGPRIEPWGTPESSLSLYRAELLSVFYYVNNP